MPGVTFDRAISYYDATRGLPDGVPEQVRARLIPLVGGNRDTHYLEVGVGTGRIALPFVTAGDDYTGIDLSAGMMSVLQEKVAAAPTGGGRLKLVRGDAMVLPLASNVFDVLIMIHLLHLVDDWKVTLAECRRVLRANGRLVISANWQRRNARPDADAQAYATPESVRAHWQSILKQLGALEESSRPRGRSLDDEQLKSYFASQGATVEQHMLVEYAGRPTTPREMAGMLRDRMYSSDWHHSDAIHQEAVRQLYDWLDNEHPAPDTASSEPSHFSVMIAQWSGEQR